MSPDTCALATLREPAIEPPRRGFGATLRRLMKRPTYGVTPGLLAKLSGVPKATIVNWIDGRVSTPRSQSAIAAICDALRLDDAEAEALYESAALTAPNEPPVAPDFDDVPVGLYATTVDGRILCANATLISMLGYDRRAYYDLDVANDLYFEASERAVWLEEIRRTRTLIRRPVVAKRADGTPIELLDSCTAIVDEAGRIVRFEGVWETTTREGAA